MLPVQHCCSRRRFGEKRSTRHPFAPLSFSSTSMSIILAAKSRKKGESTHAVHCSGRKDGLGCIDDASRHHSAVSTNAAQQQRKAASCLPTTTQRNAFRGTISTVQSKRVWRVQWGSQLNCMLFINGTSMKKLFKK